MKWKDPGNELWRPVQTEAGFSQKYLKKQKESVRNTPRALWFLKSIPRRDCRNAGHQAPKPRAGMTNAWEQFQSPFPSTSLDRQGDDEPSGGPSFKEKSEE